MIFVANVVLITNIQKKRTLASFCDILFLPQSQGASELTELGEKCQGERHVDVIEKQREAIMELRESLGDIVKNLRSASAQSEGRSRSLSAKQLRYHFRLKVILFSRTSSINSS